MRDKTTTFSLPWAAYLMEGALIGAFMIAACGLTALFEHPESPLHTAIPSTTLRRAIMAAAMGITALTLIRSRWGQRTGAHMNPAVTLSVLRTGKITPRDATGYILFQFFGAVGGVAIIHAVTLPALAHKNVHFAVTLPNTGNFQAWLAELTIAFILMFTLISMNRHARLIHFTSYAAGLLIAIYIFVEAPISGMSMNPARSFGSALWAEDFTALWIYFTAPIVGMLLGVEASRINSPNVRHLCCKLVHSGIVPCYCRCDCLAATSADQKERTANHAHTI
jgi:aquaporin Z